MKITIYESIIVNANGTQTMSLGRFETPEKSLIAYEKRIDEITKNVDYSHGQRAVEYYKPKIKIITKEVEEL